MSRFVFACIGSIFLLPGLIAQKPSSWSDDLANNLVGVWNLRGSVAGRPAHHRITARWVLNHQFIELDEETIREAPASESRYHAIWYLGHDDVTGHYVLHLLDVFGGRFSETLGNGTRDESELSFLFEYPDGPFRTNWIWERDAKSWKWHMEQKNKDGKWISFADFRMTSVSESQ